ncbi:hypothetical protein PQX77_000704 [Marasmius sp. AFHP31]|nr:hypothetical protein PQX77_000704 [Marasmius sp. AFHP31]
MVQDGTVCMPHRWFRRDGHYIGLCWRMTPIVRQSRTTWRVLKGDGFEARDDEFVMNFSEMRGRMQYHKLPDVTDIEDFEDPNAEPPVSKWNMTNPVLGNPWRAKSKGHKVLSFPVWMYCDDTSGNVSKKWNKHNSFLMTAAGLGKEQVTKEYNVHFLATSNSAPPLEMLDGIADQISDAQEHGIWAWDIEDDSPVLLLVWVLALLGDNPMQSEFACHIGLRGKFFCRTCFVKGKDAMVDKLFGPTNSGNPSDSDDEDGNEGSDGEASDGGQSIASGASGASGTGKKRGATAETFSAMFERVKRFIKACVGEPRSKERTTVTLRTQFEDAKVLGAASRLKKMRTESGVKDTYQMFFIERLVNSYKNRRGDNRQRALNTAVTELPVHMTSPVWRIRGLDPHSDTPVEILHVVLLGFVKYLWRDVIKNQIKQKDPKKKELAARLSSVGLQGLGLDSEKLPGDTCVNYYGSLNGGDFRKLVQVAPFVLHGLVSDECYATWISLSTLVPLIWQPEIDDIDAYLTLLQEEIDTFLSVHSNRQAPSKDIALAFAQGNRIRHFLSGGRFLIPSGIPRNEADVLAVKNFEDPQQSQCQRVTQVQRFLRDQRAFNKDCWATVGPSPLKVLETSRATLGRHLGLSRDLGRKNVPGTFKVDPTTTSFSQTETGLMFPDLPLFTTTQRTTGRFVRVKEFIVKNGDRCTTGYYAVVRTFGPTAPSPATLHVARIVEVLQRKRDLLLEGFGDGVDCALVEVMEVGKEPSTQGMPRIKRHSPSRTLVLQPKVSFFSSKLRRGTNAYYSDTQDIMCAVNVQHDCVQHKCNVQDVGIVRREREISHSRKGVVVHRGNSDDLLLNTAQMRSAKFVQAFRIQPERESDPEEILFKSVQRVIDARKAAQKTTPATQTATPSEGTSIRAPDMHGTPIATPSSPLQGSTPSNMSPGISVTRTVPTFTPPPPPSRPQPRSRSVNPQYTQRLSVATQHAQHPANSYSYPSHTAPHNNTFNPAYDEGPPERLGQLYSSQPQSHSPVVLTSFGYQHQSYPSFSAQGTSRTHAYTHPHHSMHMSNAHLPQPDPSNGHSIAHGTQLSSMDAPTVLQQPIGGQWTDRPSQNKRTMNTTRQPSRLSNMSLASEEYLMEHYGITAGAWPMS